MQVDLREKIKNDKMMRELPNNHRDLFERRLQKELHQKSKKHFIFMKIAASMLILLSVGFAGYQFLSTDVPEETLQIKEESNNKINSMADISPDLKKVEDYYLMHINYQFSKIKITDENRAILDVYFVELGKLQEAYNSTIKEIDSDEISEETINSLIENLQMRLKIMYQLKAQLKKIDNLNSKENESNEA